MYRHTCPHNHVHSHIKIHRYAPNSQNYAQTCRLCMQTLHTFNLTPATIWSLWEDGGFYGDTHRQPDRADLGCAWLEGAGTQQKNEDNEWERIEKEPKRNKGMKGQKDRPKSSCFHSWKQPCVPLLPSTVFSLVFLSLILVGCPLCTRQIKSICCLKAAICIQRQKILGWQRTARMLWGPVATYVKFPPHNDSHTSTHTISCFLYCQEK